MLQENLNQNEHVDHVLSFTINDIRYSWNKETITGSEIRDLAKIPIEDEIYLSTQMNKEDELITADSNINLGQPGTEHFFSKEKHFQVTLIVNLRDKNWTAKKINFQQVVTLAYGNYDPNPNKVYTVTYDNGPAKNNEGSMILGDKVFVTDKMIFNVKQSNKG
jgi:hypothetical protein